MTPYVGNSANYPTSVSQPDNSDLVNPAAATLNTPTQGALDRTAYLHLRAATLPATSWFPQVSPASSCDNAAWNPTAGTWWTLGGGNADLVKSSLDYGKSWTSIAIGLDALTVYALDFDTAGNAVVTNTGSRTLYNWTASTSTWSHDTLALLGTVNKPLVKYDSVNAVWICFYNDTTTAMRAASSTDRIAWTDRSGQLPAAFASAGTFIAHMGVGNGRVVVASKLAGTTITMATAATSALGSAWTSASIVAASLTTVTDCSNPIYSSEDGVWLISLYGQIGAANATEVWKSADGGQTWTRTVTLSSSGTRISWLANIGHLWAGLTVDGFIVYSLDVGVTWFPAGIKAATPSATNLSLWAGGGGLLVVDYGGSGPNTRASIRLSNQGAVALT